MITKCGGHIFRTEIDFHEVYEHNPTGSELSNLSSSRVVGWYIDDECVDEDEFRRRLDACIADERQG